MLFYGPQFYIRCAVGGQHDSVPNFSCPAFINSSLPLPRVVETGGTGGARPPPFCEAIFFFWVKMENAFLLVNKM